MKNKTLLLFGILPALLLPTFGTMLYFFILADSGYANLVYTGVKVVSFVWVIAFLWLLDWRLPPMPVARNLKKALWSGLLSGIIISGAGIVVFFAFEEFFRSFTPAMELKVRQMGIGPLPSYIGFSIVISILHSLFEEFYWRYFCFRGMLASLSPKVAAFVASIGFSLHHFFVLGFYFSPLLTLVLGIAVGIGGLIWCLMYLKTGTLIAPWISHIFVDAAIFYAGYVMIFT